MTPARDEDSRLLVTLNVAELEQLFAERVRAAVRDEVERLCEPRFLTIAEVAEMLRLSKPTVMNLVRAGGVLTIAAMAAFMITMLRRDSHAPLNH
jgi:predicted XRE-type DNA-binding protein